MQYVTLAAGNEDEVELRSIVKAVIAVNQRETVAGGQSLGP